MFSKLFHKKAIGFKFLGDSIKYALITFNNNTVIVNETQQFKINCKTALHRLQHLLTKYPACHVLDSSESLLNAGPQDVTAPRDRKYIVKNKIESLADSKSIYLNFQGHLKKSKAPLFIIHKEALRQRERRLAQLNLTPQKILLSNESILSLEHFFSSPETNKVLLSFTLEKVELLFLKQGFLVFSRSIKILDLPLLDIEKKILRLLYSHITPKEKLNLHFHGAHTHLKEISSSLEKESALNSISVPYGSFEEEAPLFLTEIGGALSLLKEEISGFQKATFSTLFKMYKKPLIANVLLTVGLFIVSYFYWGYKHSEINTQNKVLFEESLSCLSKSKKTSIIYSSEQIADLNALLKKKKKETPSYLFRPNSFLVSDTLAWLSEISTELATRDSAPFIIESFKYSLTSRPTLKKSSAPYRVRVSFSFSTDSSLTARMVHDKIAESKEIVDRSKKVDWSYQNNRYQIAFFLKNDLLKGEG